MSGTYKLRDELEFTREVLSDLIERTQILSDDRPVEGAEITLGLRKLQEARMWLGVALATHLGHNPWESKIEEA